MAADPSPFLDQDVGNCDVAGRLRALAPGRYLTLLGFDTEELARHLPPDMPRLLRLDLGGTPTAEAALNRILDDLADLALDAWPNWPPSQLAPWRRAADRFATVGRRPRFSQRVPAETQFQALLPAAGAPTLLFTIDPVRSERAAPLIAALEWVCRHRASAVALLAEQPPSGPPWDRMLHGALFRATPSLLPATSRLLPESGSGPKGSAVERRVRAALQAHPDLAGLFEDEVTVRLGPLGPAPRVDLLWRAGQVVVELDGWEHTRDPTYGADRHRDYELLVAGYLVLRLTNEEVERDLARSLDKIRRVVDLRRGPR